MAMRPVPSPARSDADVASERNSLNQVPRTFGFNFAHCLTRADSVDMEASKPKKTASSFFVLEAPRMIRKIMSKSGGSFQLRVKSLMKPYIRI